MKKHLIVVFALSIILLFASLFGGPFVASAQTNPAVITQLQARIERLRVLLTELQQQTQLSWPTPASPSISGGSYQIGALPTESNKKMSCEMLVGKRDLKKTINFFFVAEKFADSDRNEFLNQINTFLGLSGNDPLTVFQYTPFSEFRDNYTVKYQFIPDKDYECAPSIEGTPNDRRFCFNTTVALQSLASSCGESAYETDFIVVLSKKSFRSSADAYTLEEIDPRTRILRLSLNLDDIPPEKRERVLGNFKKIVLHEFGHSLGSLSDEYIEYAKEGYKPIANIGAANIDIIGCPGWCSGQPNTASPYYDDYLSYQSCTANLNVMDSQDDDRFKACYESVSPEAFEQNFGQSCQVGSGCFWGAGATNGFRSLQNSLMRNLTYPELGPVNEEMARVGIKNLVESRNMPIGNLTITPREVRLIKATPSTDGRSRQYQFRLEFDVMNQQGNPVLIKANQHNYDLSVSVGGQRWLVTRNLTDNNYYAFYDHIVLSKDRPGLNLIPSDEILMTLDAQYNQAHTIKNLKINLMSLQIKILSNHDSTTTSTLSTGSATNQLTNILSTLREVLDKFSQSLMSR
ncbi:MAG: hypothetical protein V1704_00780 [Candidatus Vogelbacteria bacterium]